jgi:hypothetical protein
MSRSERCHAFAYLSAPSGSVGWVERSETHHRSPKTAFRLVIELARPIRRVEVEPRHAMDRRIWPILHPPHMAMLDGIEMDVIGVPRKVVCVPQRVLPIAPLPNPALAFVGTADAYPFPRTRPREKLALMSRQRSAKSDSPPGQHPNHMEVVWQYDDSVDSERMSNPRISNAARSIYIWSVSRRRRRSARFTVKK